MMTSIKEDPEVEDEFAPVKREISSLSNRPTIDASSSAYASKEMGSLVKKLYKMDKKPNNNPKQIFNTMSKLKGSPINFLKVDQQRMVIVQYNKQMTVYDLDTYKLNKAMLDEQPNCTVLIPDTKLILMAFKTGIKLFSSEANGVTAVEKHKNLDDPDFKNLTGM